MARIRTIKPEFFTSETVANWHPITRLTFMGLLVHAEDNGVGSANERLLASLIFPMDDREDAIAWTRRALDECSRGGQIVLYEAGGRRLYAVTNWSEHQRIDRPSKTRFPRPTNGQITESFAEANTPDKLPTSENTPNLTLVDEPSTSPRRALDEPSSLEVVKEGKGYRKGREENYVQDAARPAMMINAEVVATVEPDPEPAVVDHVADHVEPYREDVEALCRHLHSRLILNDYKPLPAITKGWRDQARLLIDRDERNLDQALKLITWALENDFWSTNIASMGTFRRQYPKLLAAAQREHAGRNRTAPPTARQQRLLATAAMVERFRREDEEALAAALPHRKALEG